MNKVFTILIVALACMTSFAQSIDPALEKEMGQRKDDEKIDVFVIMKQQYDREQLNRRADYYTTRAARREFVVNELKQFAESSQYDIRQSLAEMERHDMVTEPKILWIANALYFSATKQAIYDLAKRKDVEVIGFDEEVKMIPEDEESKPAPLTRDIAPNVTQVNANQAWDLGYTGQGVVVAVIDCGVNYNHFDLKDHLWDGGEAFPNHGWDVGNNDNDPMDGAGHGTHCSGTVCGDGGGGRKTGMAPDVTLMCVKISTNNGTSSNSTLICNGIQWAVEHGCDVFSLSYNTSNKVLCRLTSEAALDAGVIGSAAAGNDGQNLNTYPVPDNIAGPGSCPPPYMDPIQQANPGGLSCVVCVGAVDYNDEAAAFTSIGPVTWSNTTFNDYPYLAGSSTQFGLIRPDVCAPGVDIVSANYADNTGYLVYSGTSMATPCVAGCMALMLSKNPELTPADICRILEETAVPLTEGKSNIYGYGRVDALAAVNAVPDNILSLASYTIHDESGNNNQQLNAGESVTMDMDLRCGPNALSNAILNITSTSEFVTITNGTIALPNFAAGQTQTVTGFAFSVDASAPIRRKMTFYADVMVGGNSVGHFAFTLAVQGTVLVYEGASIVNDNNGNGILEPGETADLRVYLNNIGNLTADAVIGSLSVASNYLNINTATASFGDIAFREQQYADFSVTLAANASNAFPMPFTINLVDAEAQTIEFNFSLVNITAAASPQGVGNLTGTGTYGTGTNVTLSASTDDSHTFICWKRGNSVVSYTDYHFVVSENANYVANFNTISNVVPIGPAATSSEFIPTYSYYNYSLTEQIYTVEELGAAFDISSVAFFNAGESKTRNCRIYLKHTEKSFFQNNHDWEAVASEDLLFEGDIVFTAGAWKTIYFTRPFAYDGNHNVLLVIDDNTGSYSLGMACRTFNAENRTIFNYNDYTNYNPYNPSDYSGRLIGQKSQVLFGISNSNYTVAVSANPTDGGNITGGGTYQAGQQCTITASANTGYTFVNWTKNGTQVSTNPTYTFTVTANANYVAHFALKSYTIATSANPAAGGVVSGGGTYNYGSSCTVTASANTGYAFVKWTKNGIRVSNDPTYTFTVTANASYVAHFALNSYTIAASANPAAGGSVSGTGTYNHGSTCTLTASANSGYTFANWTENGVVVSTNASYTFTVNGDRTLVANLAMVDGLGESNDKAVSIYPNPAQDKLTVETMEPTNLLEIISITGAVVYSQTDCPRKMEIQVGDLAEGTYLIRLTKGASVVTRIFVKQ